MREEDLRTCNGCGNDYSIRSGCNYCVEEPSLETIDANIKEWEKQLKEQGLSDEEVQKKLYEWISETF